MPIQAGDKVIRQCGFGESGRLNRSIITVTRTTKTQIIAGQERFRRRDGRRIGDSGSWHPVHIHEYTEEEAAEIQGQTRRHRAIHFLRNAHYHHDCVPTEALVQAANMLRQYLETDDDTAS